MTEAKMNPSIKKLWVAALRSGDYEQGQNCLRANDRFCCLGVLCDLHEKKTGDGEWLPEGYRHTGDSHPDEIELPPAVAEWAGLFETDPKIGAEPCSALNDGRETEHRLGFVAEHSFAEMADLIEENL